MWTSDTIPRINIFNIKYLSTRSSPPAWFKQTQTSGQSHYSRAQTPETPRWRRAGDSGDETPRWRRGKSHHHWHHGCRDHPWQHHHIEPCAHQVKVADQGGEEIQEPSLPLEVKRSIFFAESDLNHGQATLLLELIKKVLLDVEKDLPTGGYISSRPNTPGPDSSDRFERRPRHSTLLCSVQMQMTENEIITLGNQLPLPNLTISLLTTSTALKLKSFLIFNFEVVAFTRLKIRK